MSGYFDQLLSASGVLSAARPAPDAPAPVSEAPSDFMEVSEESEQAPAAASAWPGHRTDASPRDAGPMRRQPAPAPGTPEDGSSPQETSSGSAPSIAPAREGPGAPPLSPALTAAVAMAPPPPSPQPAKVTFREIVQWVTAGPVDRVDDAPLTGSGPDPVAPHSEQGPGRTPKAPPDPVPNGSDGPPSRVIGRERVVTIESPGLSASALVESDPPVAAARAAKPSPPGRSSVEPNEVTVSIGAIQVVVEGPRTVSDRVASEPRPSSVGSRLARRYLRPW